MCLLYFLVFLARQFGPSGLRLHFRFKDPISPNWHHITFPRHVSSFSDDMVDMVDFCAVKFQVLIFDKSSQLPRARILKSKLASGYTLIKLHLSWTCILVWDLPGLYNCFTIGYNRNEPGRFAWAGWGR